MKNTIAIIGGSQEQTFKKIGQKYGCDVLFHSGKTRNGGTKKDFRPIVKKADCVVFLLEAVGHVSMDIVKELCKDYKTNFVCHNSMGASGAIKLGLQKIDAAA